MKMKTSINALCLLIIALCYINNTEAATCSPYTGPNGARQCIKISGYTDYQWATCRRDSYLKSTTGGRHYCRNQNHNYCLYQCMLEKYSRNSGVVLRSCLCKSASFSKPTTTPPVIVPLPLPSWCYSQNGTECKWYKECLNKAYPACEIENRYSINFAETFCELSDQNLTGFSSQGKQWLNAARRCLQSKLLPFIRRTSVPSCIYLRAKSIDEYTQCRLNPGQSLPSYCSLPVKDRLIEFWHIRLNTDFDATYEPGLKNILDIMKECRNIPQENSLVKAAKDKMDKISKNRAGETELRIKYWLEDPPTLPIQLDMFLKDVNWKFLKDASADSKSQFGAKVVDAVALDQKWVDKGVTMFAYVIENGNTLSIRLLMDDRYKYIKNAFARPADLQGVLVQLTGEVMNGTLNFQVGNGAQIAKLNGCLDWNCKEHAFSVKRNSASHGTTYALVSLAISVINIIILS